jgi:hypothetical protein
MNQEILRARTVVQLRRAAQTMQAACAEAERHLVTGDGVACQRVLHAFTWGLANASSSIETAMSHVEDAHAVAALEAEVRSK